MLTDLWFYIHNFFSHQTKKKINYFLLSLIVVFCALISFLVHRIFLLPKAEYAIVTGGLCGLSTIITKFLILTGLCASTSFHLVFSYIDFLLNIPVIIIACLLGLRFAWLTILYIVSFHFFHVSLEHLALLSELAENFIQQGELTRIVIAALIDGFLEAVVIGIGASSGGIHTIMHYLTRHRSNHRRLTSWILFFNLIIISIFSLLSFVESGRVATIVHNFIFAIMLSFLTKKAIDWHDFRNSQEQIQITTANQQLVTWLIAQGWHGATVVSARGAYTQEDKIIIYMTVAAHETKNIIHAVQQYDPRCFINLVTVKQLHGHFLLRNFDII